MAGERGEGTAAKGAAAGGAPQEAWGAADQGRKASNGTGGETETEIGEEQSTLGLEQTNFIHSRIVNAPFTAGSGKWKELQ